MRLFRRALAALALAAPLAAALPKITRKGRFLFDESGNRFYIKGVAYQPQGTLAASSEANEANGGFPEPQSYVDPLSSPANCTRDLPYLKQLGVNAVRVYSVNPHDNHDACMAAFNQAGIYVLLDVSLPLNGSIDRSAPSWTTDLLNEYLTTINVFSAYENILGYNIGNEVVTLPSNTNALPFVKAAARDVKAYLTSINSSALVGYSATDGPDDFRTSVAEYLTCGDDAETVDLFGLNNYAWCGDSNLQASTWSNMLGDFTNLTVPAYMSEFGCVAVLPRQWTEVAALFSAPMTDVFSGGVAFSYFAANNGPYALTNISDNGQVTPSEDFGRLSAQFNATQPPNSPAMDSVNNTVGNCPQNTPNFLASSTLPPTPNQDACNCVNNKSLGCHIVESTASSPLKIGALLDYTCSQLSQLNSSATCQSSIGSNGTTGVYGSLSMCSPEIKLNWAMSAYWIATGLKDESCSFAGNASLVAGRPTSGADANTLAQQCLDGKTTVTTPTATNAPAAPAPTDPAQISGTGSAATSSVAPHSGAAAGTSAPGIALAALALVLGAAVAV